MDGSISAVILAAGLSTRMGMPKMLLPWGERTVLGQVVSTYAQAGVSDIVIVTGGARLQVEEEAMRLSKEYPIRVVYNPEHEKGEMLSSLQAGLQKANPAITAVLIGLGDQPQISRSAIQQVISAHVAIGASLVVPSFNLRRGHPWLVHKPLWAEIMSLSAPQTMRDFLQHHSRDILYVDADESILKDMDTPQDYQRERP